jgi:quercetin dioxygenase-like cupin family protein
MNSIKSDNMKIYSFLRLLSLLIVSIIISTAKLFSQETNDKKVDTAILVNVSNLKWTTQPNGIKVAIIQGDPAKPGLFTQRFIFPAGMKLPLHWHTSSETITVITGSLYHGIGLTPDEAKATKMQAGAFMVIPPNTTHFAFTKEECIVQVQGTGPFVRNVVNNNKQ